MKVTIASLEGMAKAYLIKINNHGHVVCFMIRTENKYVKWTLKPHAKDQCSINTLEFNHDTFEGLVKRLGIDPETTISD
jgi:hypothetical protein